MPNPNQSSNWLESWWKKNQPQGQGPAKTVEPPSKPETKAPTWATQQWQQQAAARNQATPTIAYNPDQPLSLWNRPGLYIPGNQAQVQAPAWATQQWMQQAAARNQANVPLPNPLMTPPADPFKLWQYTHQGMTRIQQTGQAIQNMPTIYGLDPSKQFGPPTAAKFSPDGYSYVQNKDKEIMKTWLPPSAYPPPVQTYSGYGGYRGYGRGYRGGGGGYGRSGSGSYASDWYMKLVNWEIL